MHLNADEILKATGGQWLVAPAEDFGRHSGFRRIPVRWGMEISLSQLKGESFDAHAFLADVVSKGASGVVVERADSVEKLQNRVPVLWVKDTLRALGAMAAAWRAKCPAHRIAVVGSAGKTTTKEMLAHLLRRFCGQPRCGTVHSGQF